MEETESVGFNKRRAEGLDKSDGPKKVLPLKDRKLNTANTICYLQGMRLSLNVDITSDGVIMGTGMDTQDTSPSVLLFFDKRRFIFNAGEGLQRFCTEHKIKLSKIDHIFLSRVCSETVGGIPGLLLTLAGMGEEGMSVSMNGLDPLVNVWGPSDFKYFVDAMRSFIPAAMVHTHSFGPSPGSDGISIPNPMMFTDPIVLIDDEVVKISAILLRSNASEASQLNNENCPLLNARELDLEERRNQFSEPLLRRSPNNEFDLAVKPGDISVIYVCELPEILGKFDPKKAVAFGLRPGSKYRELQLGNSVKSDRQNIMVHPSDVVGPSIPGPIVLVVDCQTSSHLQELLSSQSLSNYYGDVSGTPPGISKTVNCIIHLSPASVTDTNDYQKWMTRFTKAQHIMAGLEKKNIEVPILKASARIAARLNYLCPKFFPAPGFWSIPHLNGSAPGALSEAPASKLCESVSAENLLKFHLRPYSQLGLDRSGVPSTISPSEIIDELLSEIPEIEAAAQQITCFWHGDKQAKEDLIPMLNNNLTIEEPWLNLSTLPSCLEDISREDMEIVLLGTGSAQPSKYRNVSSIFINLFSKGSLLLDCGEGTLGQLKRRFGVGGADDAVRGLRCIWISHIHADHHTGLARILALRRDLLKGVSHEPLLVIGPRQLKRFLNAYQILEDLDMQFLDCRHTTEASLEAFDSNNDTSPSESQTSTENGTNAIGHMNQDHKSTLFAREIPMQSHWKRPDSPVNNSMVSSILRNLKKVLTEAGLEALISFPVVHCPQAFGVVLKAADRINAVGKVVPGWKIVYSGDSRPCPELIKASHGATVLIHEASFHATFEDALVDEAIARNHSTTKEAIEVGDAAGAYRIILTHFSQRYPKIPVFDETHMHKTCIAFDLMSVNLADLHILPRVLPYLKILFQNEMIVDESDGIVNVASAAN
ncbi:Zinc phosphodiesterase ELAC protein like [Actinidia chinensis var. chinensis]|uniref:ribonuclease Z n=1 Tax=Actinidia chinensis var. chinensis TaxID=1590841 RepID=A0A2R6QFK6_ACTCC|nr:Zinc phosphodiesterase ELAC protein like [Actinidia chinensis var. chinensis]